MNSDSSNREEIALPPQDPQPSPPTLENPKSSSFACSVFEILEMFAWSVFAVLILFTFCFRLTNVEGESMENTLQNGEKLLVYNLGYEPKQDDIIVFHMTKPEVGLEKAMVKRVIATGGQLLRIDFTKQEITVDGVLYEDSHAVLKSIRGDIDLDYYLLTANHYYDQKYDIFEARIPEGMLFVMGDNRNNSKDSRNSDVGFIDERSVLGKVFLRIYPFTLFG